MKDLISIIVPIYNVESCVNKCIKSIISQTYKKLEIILVDDGSTDGSGKICDDWSEKDQRIIVVHKENGGLSDARNSGLRIASGRYVGFVDGDDWIAEDMYEYLYMLIQRYNADISICEHFVETEQGDLSTEGVRKSDEDVLERKSALLKLIQDDEMHSYAWDKLYKKELLKGIEFPFGRYVEDMFTQYKVFLNSNRIVLGHEPKYYYFQRSSSLQHTGGEKHEWDQFCAYREWYQKIPMIYPEYRQYLLLKWVSFTVSAYNSLILLEEIGTETAEHRQVMYDTIEKHYKEISWMKSFDVKWRLFLIKRKGYSCVYPILKKMVL